MKYYITDNNGRILFYKMNGGFLYYNKNRKLNIKRIMFAYNNCVDTYILFSLAQARVIIFRENNVIRFWKNKKEFIINPYI